MSKIEFSLTLPTYNEGLIFQDNVDRIISVLKKTGRSWEIIFVEDKSTDQTRKYVDKFVATIPNAKAIYHLKNQGRGKSVSDGIRAAKGNICGYLDVDLEVSEKYIPACIKEIENGVDLVVGKRFYEGGIKNLTRFVLSKAYALTVKFILKLPINDTEAGYKFFNRKKILPILPKVNNKYWFWDTEICVQAYLNGLKLAQIPVLFKRNPEKKSTVHLVPDTIDYIRNLIRLKSQISNYKSQTNPKSQIINSRRF